MFNEKKHKSTCKDFTLHSGVKTIFLLVLYCALKLVFYKEKKQQQQLTHEDFTLERCENYFFGGFLSSRLVSTPMAKLECPLQVVDVIPFPLDSFGA